MNFERLKYKKRRASAMALMGFRTKMHIWNTFFFTIPIFKGMAKHLQKLMGSIYLFIGDRPFTKQFTSFDK